LLRLNALNREIAREAASDRRYQQAAKSLRRIAKTLDRNISDDQLAKFAAVNRASQFPTGTLALHHPGPATLRGCSRAARRTSKPQLVPVAWRPACAFPRSGCTNRTR
jgi:hypothetical protein